jgi:hypothetical protein
VGGVYDQAPNHLLCFGYLVLDDQPDWAEGGMKGSDPPQVIVTIGFLAGHYFIVVDEVEGHHLVQRSRSPLTLASVKRLANALFSSADDTAVSSSKPT